MAGIRADDGSTSVRARLRRNGGVTVTTARRRRPRY